jgi:beta-glucosidase
MTDFSPRKGATAAEIETLIEGVLAEATLAEKVGMMSGQGFFKAYYASGSRWAADPYRAGGGIERLELAPFWFTDGPRGVARGNSTCFPCTMARGASFDTDLEQRIGAAMGVEIRAQGCDLSGAVCVNLLRHPAWGRAQETYGEDPHHLGRMGAALGAGLQVHNVAATVKHFAVNSIENARFKVDVRVDERTLHEVYLPHFKHIVDSGIQTVMSAYNKLNGTYCGENHPLLTGILRDEWGFDGFVHSDWIMGVYDVMGAAAGLDVENPEPRVFGDALLKAVEDGRIEPAVIDTACRRILRIWYRIKCATDPQAYDMTMVASPKHIDLAREAAEKSAVLLKNDAVLPFESGVKTLAVLGRLAALDNTGDFGSSRVRPPHVVSAIEGLSSRATVLTGDESDLPAAVASAQASDAVVIVTGYTAREEGEYIPGDMTLNESAPATERVPGGGDRASLELPEDQIALIEAVAATGKPLVVVIVAGSAVIVERWHDRAGAILQTFYSGMEGGTALARLLFGDVSPSGRLPFTVARDAANYPFFDRDADAIDYGYWHGYAKMAQEQLLARYPFGYGLSYTAFSHRDLNVAQDSTRLSINLTVTNTGTVPGDEIIQCYIGFPGTVQPRADRLLAAFARVSLAPGETKPVALAVDIDELRYRDIATHGWVLERGDYRIQIARHAEDGAPLEAIVTL